MSSAEAWTELCGFVVAAKNADDPAERDRILSDAVAFIEDTPVEGQS